MKSFLRISNVYFALALVILAGAAAYGIVQAREYSLEKNAIVTNGALIQQKENALKSLKEQYDSLAGNEVKKQEEITRKIMNILPPDENYTDLTRELDKYFDENDTVTNPIFQSSLRFGKGAPVAGMTDISALPLTMNIDATRDNFFKFLNYANDSGSLETGTRLIEITSIQLNFPEEGEMVKDSKQKINFTVDLNAFYRTPKVAR